MINKSAKPNAMHAILAIFKQHKLHTTGLHSHSVLTLTITP